MGADGGEKNMYIQIFEYSDRENNHRADDLGPGRGDCHTFSYTSNTVSDISSTVKFPMKEREDGQRESHCSKSDFLVAWKEKENH